MLINERTDTTIEYEGVRRISDMLCINTTLVCLALSGINLFIMSFSIFKIVYTVCKIEYEGLKKITESLKINNTLTALYLDCLDTFFLVHSKMIIFVFI